jgi:hypothetical protein
VKATRPTVKHALKPSESESKLLVDNLQLVAEGIVLEGAVELLWRLREAAVDLIVEAEEEAHSVEGHLRVVREHVAVHVQHDGRVGQHC